MRRLGMALVIMALVVAAIRFDAARMTPVHAAGEQSKNAERESAPKEEDAVAVAAAVVTPGSLQEEILCEGEAQSPPDSQQMLTSRVAGTVDKVLCRDSDTVHRGDVLLQLDRRAFDISQARAAAAVDEARAELEKAESATNVGESDELKLALTTAEHNYEQAKLTAERERSLAQSHLVAERQLQEAERNEKMVAAQLAAARKKADLQANWGHPEEKARLGAKLRQAEADLRLADLNVSCSVIRAEQDGVLSDFKVSRGQYVEANTLLGRIVDPAMIEFLLHLPVEQAAKVNTGDVVEVYDSGTTSECLTGRVARISASALPGGATVTVRATLDSRSQEAAKRHGLIPGEFVRAVIRAGQNTTGLLVPRVAVVTEEQNHFVYVIGTDHKARKTTVTLEAESTAVAVVQGDLRAGQSVVTDGAYNLPDGVTVREQR